MNANSLREAAALLILEADKLEGKLPSGAGEVERERIRQALERQKPHEWRDWTGGNPSDAGDNSDTPETDAFMRAFQPMMTAAGRYPQQTDSTGAVFFAPNIRKRGGWPMLYKECLALVLSPWGQAWMSDPLNASICPKPAAIAQLVQQAK